MAAAAVVALGHNSKGMEVHLIIGAQDTDPVVARVERPTLHIYLLVAPMVEVPEAHPTHLELLIPQVPES